MIDKLICITGSMKWWLLCSYEPWNGETYNCPTTRPRWVSKANS